MLRVAILSLIALIGISTSAAHAAPAISLAGPWDSIAFDVNSWGRPIGSWYITSTGGNWTRTVPKEGGTFADYSLVVYEITANAEKYSALSAILARLPNPVPEYEACHDRMFDLPYGKLRLTRGATTVEISWNSGCQDPAYVAFLDVLKAADTCASEWGKAGKVLRTEVHGASQPSP